MRINGRLMLKNVFKEIWNLEMHPYYNHFLVKVNIISDKREALPKTRTTKNGIRMGDEKLLSLYDLLRNMFPKPPRNLAGAVKENELVEELRKIKEIHLPDSIKVIKKEFNVFNSIGANTKADLYIFDGQNVILYEAKKDEADVQNVYQLLMYWDGCVDDGIKPNIGILIASTFTNAVKKLINIINNSFDSNGNNYNFVLKTWKDEGINYPK